MVLTGRSEEEPARKKRRTTGLSTKLNIRFEGYPLFLLLELIPHVPHLDDATLLRSVYDADVGVVKEGWGDWFYHLMKMPSNEDRCQILKATFRIFPELAAEKILVSLRDGTWGREFPLVAMLRSWPKGTSIPVDLLDHLSVTMRSYDLHLDPWDFTCSNKEDVARWALQSNFLVDASRYCGAIRPFAGKDVTIWLVRRGDKEETKYELRFSRKHSAIYGQYWSERVRRLLQSRTNYPVSLGTSMPNWFRELIVDEARTASKVSFGRVRLEVEQNPLVPVLREMQRNPTLAEFHLECDNDSEEFFMAVYDVLRCCPSLRVFRFCGLPHEPRRELLIPRMKNLDTLDLNHALLPRESLEPMFCDARVIKLNLCKLHFASTEPRTSLPSCFEGWAKGLHQNTRLEELRIDMAESIAASGRYRICTRAFARALGSRPRLTRIQLHDYELEESGRPAFDLSVEDMRELSMTTSLETLELPRLSSDALEGLLKSFPGSLRVVRWSGVTILTKGGFLALLDLLAQSRQQQVEFPCRSLRLNLDSASFVEGDDERLRHPMSSFIDVLKHRNSTLTSEHAFIFPSCTQKERREITFWCGLNLKCPNRLELRKKPCDSYPYQLEKFTNDCSYSEAFELIRSTFHLWSS